ncbi:MAG TPA: hypothetical protein VN610_09245 [Bryobacteraceae bacterium]|nr:hypothetical protein [Bryobacteraceae bacterium]
MVFASRRKYWRFGLIARIREIIKKSEPLFRGPGTEEFSWWQRTLKSIIPSR